MRRKRFSEEQIVSILKESAAGMKTEEDCRRYGICTNTFYRWKRKYQGTGKPFENACIESFNRRSNSSSATSSRRTPSEKSSAALRDEVPEDFYTKI